MKYHLFTTAKFIKECIAYGVYGSTNSNWLSNVEIGDIIYISQFNYASQEIFGPFKVIKKLFYDKMAIYPGKKYYFRVAIKPLNSVKKIEETDLYLRGINDKSLTFSKSLISLIQQNKHLHVISLTDQEGEYISKTFNDYGVNLSGKVAESGYEFSGVEVNLGYLFGKNNLQKKKVFSSESYLESFILLCLKSKTSQLSKNFSEILSLYPDNELPKSTIYNQFVLGNAYPVDIVIINDENVNIIELKKEKFKKFNLGTVQKEFRKYCFYSLFSERLQNLNNNKRINFFLIFFESKNQNFYKIFKKEFDFITKPLKGLGEINFQILEYYIEEGDILFRLI